MISDEEFEQFILSQLEFIDKILSSYEVDLSERPFAAADIFIKECIIKVNDNPPDGYYIQPWFKYIIYPIIKWYESKYGETAIRSKAKISKGIVLFNGVFYELKIPLRVIIPKGELQEYIFPKEFLPFEKEIDFITTPKIVNEKDDVINSLNSSIRSIVNLTRSIGNYLLNCEFNHHLCKELSSGIQVHIQKAVDDILTCENSRFLISFWEIHLAIELSAKVLIIQLQQNNIESHDLIELWNALELLKPGIILKEQIKEFPSAKKVIKYRYGEGPNIKKKDVYKNYLSALNLIAILTKEYKRKTTFQNTAFFLGKLPWQK